MPQLDAATYLSQVTWLTLFFVSYYFVGLNFILPSLSGRLKVRAKKVSLSKGRVSGFDGERISALSSYDSALFDSCGWVSRNLQNTVISGDSWRNQQTRVVDSVTLISPNTLYLTAMSSTLAQPILSVSVTSNSKKA